MSGTLDERRELLRFLREVGALQFGAFTLRSGRVSPYFFNSARFQTGAQVERLGDYYAAAIARVAPQAGIVFGPAYKGIPLCVSAAIALSRRTGREIGYLFNRKEAKTHGDTGRFVGREPGPGDRMVLVDDVITDGGTKLEAVKLLRDSFEAPIDALVIAFNRMETDLSGEDAVARFEGATGIPVVPLLTVADLETALGEEGAWEGTPAPAPQMLEEIRAYRRRYGVGAG
ncbi:MAG TPA: orotate phosphoribosyltransferase [bacterium]|nr:orotate phosphoribosyltransferase [bacterium]